MVNTKKATAFFLKFLKKIIKKNEIKNSCTSKPTYHDVSMHCNLHQILTTWSLSNFKFLFKRQVKQNLYSLDRHLLSRSFCKKIKLKTTFLHSVFYLYRSYASNLQTHLTASSPCKARLSLEWESSVKHG